VDCDAGRKLGCQTFCCRLIVRLAPAEEPRGRTDRGTLAKDPVDGWCVHLDRATHQCRIWAERPEVCRRYDCNRDPKLQIVIRDSYSDLVPFRLREAAPKHAERVIVPHRK
jgi:Fe-S-cluster containining protein